MIRQISIVKYYPAARALRWPHRLQNSQLPVFSPSALSIANVLSVEQAHPILETLIAGLPLIRVQTPNLKIKDKALLKMVVDFYLRGSGLQTVFEKSNNVQRDLHSLAALQHFAVNSQARDILAVSLNVPAGSTADLHAALINLMHVIKENLGKPKPWDAPDSHPATRFELPPIKKSLEELNPSHARRTPSMQRIRVAGYSLSTCAVGFCGSLIGELYLPSNWVTHFGLPFFLGASFVIGVGVFPWLHLFHRTSHHPGNIARRVYKIYENTFKDLQEIVKRLHELEPRWSNDFGDYIFRRAQPILAKGQEILLKIEHALAQPSHSEIPQYHFEKNLLKEAEDFKNTCGGLRMVATGMAKFKDGEQFEPKPPHL